MSTPDFFCSRLDAMIDMQHPLAVLAGRLPWARIEAALAPKFTHQDRPARQEVVGDLLGAAGIKGANFSTTPLVALPSAPLELSIWLTAGESFSSSSTAPSPANAGSVHATRSISPTASFRRSMALRVPLHPNALRRKLALKAQG